MFVPESCPVLVPSCTFPCLFLIVYPVSWPSTPSVQFVGWLVCADVVLSDWPRAEQWVGAGQVTWILVMMCQSTCTLTGSRSSRHPCTYIQMNLNCLYLYLSYVSDGSLLSLSLCLPPFCLLLLLWFHLLAGLWHQVLVLTQVNTT